MLLAALHYFSIILNRSPSSIQTQASRVGLPRRNETLQRHRRRWSEDEELDLQVITNKHTDMNGKIRIDRIASEMDRSVDAIVAKLAIEFDGHNELIKRIYIPNAKIQKLIEPNVEYVQEEKEIDPMTGHARIEDTRSQAKMRKCITCRKPFYSEGAHNRIYEKCTKAHDGEDFFGGY